jgi:DNA-binding NtrC family response regulator
MHYIIPFFGIEDDPDDTDLIKEACNKKGITDYEFFPEPGEFLEVFRQSAGVRVVVIDYNLPKMNGQEVLQKVLAIRPKCRCIVISGILTLEVIARLKDASDFVVKSDKGWENQLAEKIKQQIDIAHDELQEEIRLARINEDFYKTVKSTLNK